MTLALFFGFFTLFFTFAWCGIILWMFGGRTDVSGAPVLQPLVGGLSISAMFFLAHAVLGV